MEEADVRIDPLDDLSVHFQHHAQHAMRGRVLRAEVHHIIGDIDLTRLRGDEFIQCIGHYFLPSASTGDGAPGASGFAFSSPGRSEEHTSELPSLMRISYAVFFLNKKKHTK